MRCPIRGVGHRRPIGCPSSLRPARNRWYEGPEESEQGYRVTSMDHETSTPSSMAITKLYGALWHFAEGSRHLVVLFFSLLILAQIARLGVPYFFGQAV